MNKVLIYGATGYTGELIAREAVRRELETVVAGRDATKVHRLADELGVEARVFDLSDEESTRVGVLGISVVLNAAGPFSVTSAPLLDAALYVPRTTSTRRLSSAPSCSRKQPTPPPERPV